MNRFTAYVKYVEWEEYDLVVEAKNIKSIKDEWENISGRVDDWCHASIADGIREETDGKDDGMIEGTEIKIIFGTDENKGRWVDECEVVSVRKENEDE